MAAFIAKIISKKILGERRENNFGKEDPYFETVPATRLRGRPSSKTKKRRKALPAGISEHDGKVLTKVKRRAYRLDMSLFNCCGIRFGWSSLIGIIPGIGDIIDAFMAVMVLRTCEQVEGGLPADVKSKMLFNIAVDFGIGLVPFIGDLADALFRANTKNAVLLEKHLRQKGAKALKSQGRETPAVDPSDATEFDRVLMEENGPPPSYTSSTPTRREAQSHSNGNGHGQEIVPEQRGGGWLGGFGSRSKKPDIEHGSEARSKTNEPVPVQDPRSTTEPARNKPTLQRARV